MVGDPAGAPPRDVEPRIARWILLGVCLAALGLRIACVLASRSSPLFDHPQMDAEYHVEWARAFARGEDFQPGPFFRAPLYPWFLGLCFRFFGEDLLLPRLLQALLGTLSVALVYRIGALVFDRRVGLVASAAAATYWMSIYFEAELLLPVLEMLFDLAAIERTLVAGRTGRARDACAAGAAWGTAALVRPNVLAFVPILALWLLRDAEGRRGRATRLASFTLGLAALLAPIATYNRVGGGDSVLVSSQGGVNFYIGNNPVSDGSTAIVPGTRGDWWGGYHDSIAIAERARGRSLRPSEVSDYYTELALAWARENPAAALRHQLWKFRLFWMDWELGNNVDERFFALRYVPFLRWLPLGFGVLAALGLIGLVLAWRRLWSAAPLLLFVPVYTATVVAFFVCSRYRMPVVPPLAILAAVAGVHVFDAWRGARWRSVLATAVAATGLVLLLEQVPASVDRSGAQGWCQLGKLALDRRDFVEAANCYHAAREARPGLALTHEGLGLALVAMGREQEGAESLRRAVELDLRLVPNGAERLLQLELAREAYDAALQLARAIDAAFPHSAQGPYDESRVHYSRFERLRAGGATATAQHAALDACAEALRRAQTRVLDAELSFAVPYSLGKVALESGRAVDAVLAFETALDARRAPDPDGWYFAAVRDLVRALRLAGRGSEVEARLDALVPTPSKDPRAAAVRAELLGH